MKASKLFNTTDIRDIVQLSINTQDIGPGSCFFCIQGASVDRHLFIDEAIEKGAVAVVHSKDIETLNPAVLYIKVHDVHATLVAATDILYGYPSEHLHIYGVTGTNGKTSVSYMIYNLLMELGVSSGYMGTVAIKYADIDIPARLTTPDIIDLRKTLADMVDKSVDSLAMEVSSQGLALGRVDGIDFDVVGFTNLTLDHLDYHKTMDAYFKAKKQLFDSVKKDCIMVINKDDVYGRILIESKYENKCVTYGLDQDAEYRGANVQLYDDHTEFDLIHDQKTYHIKSPFVARFNVYNLILAIAMIHEYTQLKLDDICSASHKLHKIQGRVNFITAGQPFKVIVDYSHTPDGMEKMYQFCKDILPEGGKIISVFGSAGGRDHDKRPLMGAVSDVYCDMIILTEDDPRTESVQKIAHEISEGISKHKFEFIPNRLQAIKRAVHLATEKDILVIMGKGLETYQHGPNGKEAWIGDPQAIVEAWEDIKNGNA